MTLSSALTTMPLSLFSPGSWFSVYSWFYGLAIQCQTHTPLGSCFGCWVYLIF
jgi:hypothetical protein